LTPAVRWAAICWIVVFWRLGYTSLLDPDEAHYAQLTREMVHAKSWLIPLLDGVPFIDKPVLFHWLQGASVALLGETEFAVRLPTALAAIAGFALTRWAGTILFDATIGEWAAIMFATAPATFALASVALFDMMFAVFLFGTVVCLSVAALRPAMRRAQFLGFALLALAIMTKGPVALLLVGLWTGLILAMGTRSRRLFGALQWKWGLLAVLLAVAPWFAWMYMSFGTKFVDEYLLAGNIWYFTQPTRFSGRTVSHTYYARVFIAAFFPWSLITIGRAWCAARAWRDGLEVPTEEAWLWAWVIVVLGFFTAARFKLDHYIFPAAPAIAIIAGRTWIRAGERRGPGGLPAWSIVAVSVTLMSAAVVGAAIMYRIDLDLDATAMLLPLALAVSGGWLLVQIYRRGGAPPPTPSTVVTGLLTAYAVVVVVGFPVLEKTRPMAHVARRIVARTHVTDPVAIYRLERWRASLRYYVNRPVTRLKQPNEVREFVAHFPAARVVMLRSEFETLRDSGVPVEAIYGRRGVVGTTGRGLRRQRWDLLVIVTSSATARALRADRGPGSHVPQP
jgi:4-amino-4-deoxy-L-arabinose transferase-like glycosyltransferase